MVCCLTRIKPRKDKRLFCHVSIHETKTLREVYWHLNLNNVDFTQYRYLYEVGKYKVNYSDNNYIGRTLLYQFNGEYILTFKRFDAQFLEIKII